ncbi:hypothetical protein AWM70_08130 [Paenibacillus yonginensis]|uniref:Apea-like HEPN domain-containing protein n=1 Tax=Paenibacillus yonginensis TaxID=1462996 RepID=A0A1B1MZF5_9BACL|nr:hypothetical protein [Paenibacillus yonginensis]ANS74555.1 hypothetical protein AWM70_08130 [Paenibacillus yonginensis]
MQAIIPIDNFNIEKSFKLGNVVFLPANQYKISSLKQKPIELPNVFIEDDLEAYEFAGESLRDLASVMTGIHLEDVWNITVAVIELDHGSMSYYLNSKDQDEVMLIEACNKLEQVMDIVRVNFCRMDNSLMNPGLAGLLNTGYSGMILISPDEEDQYRIIGNRFYGLTMVNGIGLELSEQQIDILLQSEFVSMLIDEELNGVKKLSRLALRRLSEAMYVPHLDSKFIYLMTTIETLASREYLNFKKVKSKVVPLIVKSKSEYHALSEELREYSEDVRTEIVHNGKSISDISTEYRKILLRLQFIIVRYVVALNHSGCSTEEELEELRLSKMRELGIS